MKRPSWIGQTMGGRYQIRELLGQGGMSAVYKADDPNLRRVVAVKLIHGHLSGDREFVRRFKEEAAAVAQLRHPNIIQVFDFNHDEDTYYIVFEFIPGESLQSRLKRLGEANRKLAHQETIQIAASIADALDYAHRRNIIHRDIKPANVMLNVQGEAILMDFGIVKMVGGDSHTASGAVMGTARYMSPEQIKGESIDARTDIYSMGVMLYEMVGGRPPFQADSAMTLMMMHINDPVPDVRNIRPDVPSGLINVINKALAKNREDRYQSAAEFSTALRAISGEQGRTAQTVLEKTSSPTQRQSRTVQESRPSQPPAPAPITSGERTVYESRTASAAAQRAGTERRSPSTPPPASRPSAPSEQIKSGGRRNTLIGGAAIAILAIICLVAAGIIAGRNLLSGGDDPIETPTTEAVAENLTEQAPAIASVAPKSTNTPTPEPFTPTAIPEPTDTPPEPTLRPTNTPLPTETPTPEAQPTQPPTPTQQQGPFLQINSIALNGDTYVVEYSPIGYAPVLPGTHIHFFFDTVPPQNAGIGPTAETWFVYGGPNPFTGYKVSDRPGGATQICALVANPDHTIQMNTGNCMSLPG